MLHQGLINEIGSSSHLEEVVYGLKRGMAEQQVYDLAESAYALWIAALYHRAGRPLLVITPGLGEAQKLAEDLLTFLPPAAVVYFPPREIFPGEILAASRDLDARRMETIQAVLQPGTRPLVVTPAEALAQLLPPPAVLAGRGRVLTPGQEVPWDDLLREIEELGYARAELVDSPGQYGVRGGIVDIYPLAASRPVRLEFFGDTLSSLRFFDPATQRSIGELDQFRLTPAREVFVSSAVLAAGVERLEREYRDTLGKLERQGRQAAAQALTERLAPRLAALQEGRINARLDDLLPYFFPQGSTLLDYFPVPPVAVWIDPGRARDTLEQHLLRHHEVYAEMVAQGRVLPSQARTYVDGPDLFRGTRQHAAVYLTLLPRRVPDTRPVKMVPAGVRALPPYNGHLDLVAEAGRRWLQEGYRVVILSGTQGRARSLKDFFQEEKLPATGMSDIANLGELPRVVVSWGSLSQGSEFPEQRLVILTEYEIFGQRRRSRSAHRAIKEGTALRSYQELEGGDYVVHVQHGIGRYLGIQQLEVGGIARDYLLIQYAGEDRLYVPTDQVHLIQKYVGAEGHVPRLNKLGSQDWSKTRQRVKESVQDLAHELLQLYAVRQTAGGIGYGQDTVWQREFEEAFPYQETPDQLRAIADVAADMARTRPMDRLICGDVGYGKTEVAMRAAFRAVQAGYQVAVLVPTTVLAQQHYQSFRERFAPYPVRIEVLSRFRKPKEQEEVLRTLARGQVDIVIGTHRLISDDVVFRNLGLLIIDEEQRFGVMHKEKIKKWRSSVDVLTLTATPIPRTLHMSLAGVRDMSVIETPPEDRYPVQTYVVEYSEQLVQEAIRREMARHGQVYFVHNRVMDIDRVAHAVKRLVPEARVAIAHGQMKEDALEQVMLDFVEGVYDVLVCSTIVENGLDIPNVNTLIVDEADNFGLAQLYQLRGRVGRSNRMAYAYFTYRKDKVISLLAEKRLAALKEFTALGSGFKIALRDLELRGAGNLLGAEQHGHMLAVGFEMYCRLLEEAVQELQGRPAAAEKASIPLEINVNAYISDHYLPESALKMEIYQRLATAREVAEVEELAAELADRFGEPPSEVKNLLAVARLRVLAQENHVMAVKQKGPEVSVIFQPDFHMRGEKLMRLAAQFPRQLTFSATGGLTMRVRTTGLEPPACLELLEAVLRRLAELAEDGASGASQQAGG